MKTFSKILKTGRQSQFLWSDKGREFYNRDFKKLLDENGISLYSTENEEKSSVVKRWNIRTIKNRIWKLFAASNSTSHIDKLDQILQNYNQTKHRSIKMTPEQVSKKENKDRVYLNLYGKELP